MTAIVMNTMSQSMKCQSAIAGRYRLREGGGPYPSVNPRYGGRYRSPVKTVAGNDYRRPRLSDGVGYQGIVANRSPLRRAGASNGGGAQARPLTAKLWSLTDMVRVIEDWEAARSAKISGGTVIG